MPNMQIYYSYEIKKTQLQISPTSTIAKKHRDSSTQV